MASFQGVVYAGAKSLHFMARTISSNPTTTLKKLGCALAFSNVSSSQSNSSGPSNYLSSSSGSSNAEQRNSEGTCIILSGSPFVEMLEKTDYEPIFGKMVDYEIFVVRKQLHWLLMVRMESSELSFVTIEITTMNLHDCIPTMRRLSRPTTSFSTTHLNGNRAVPLLTCKPEKVGIYRGKLLYICKAADSVLANMKNYNLLTNNCQHFINNLLSRMGFKIYRTTVGPQLSITLTEEEKQFDLLSTLTTS